jgi:hypothetical protein
MRQQYCAANARSIEADPGYFSAEAATHGMIDSSHCGAGCELENARFE